jgi:hypothetical protein
MLVYILLFLLFFSNKIKIDSQTPNRKYNDMSTSEKEHSKWRLLKVNVT